MGGWELVASATATYTSGSSPITKRVDVSDFNFSELCVVITQTFDQEVTARSSVFPKMTGTNKYAVNYINAAKTASFSGAYDKNKKFLELYVEQFPYNTTVAAYLYRKL